MPTPKGYTRIQIRLHWIVFLLVAGQYIFGDGISHAYRAILRDGATGPFPAAIAHIAVGVVIFALVVWRMAIKKKRGAPAMPEDQPAYMNLVANVTHLGLYALLILMVISGGMAWFGGQHWAGDMHADILKPILLIVVVLHVAAGIYHHFVKKDDVMRRMVRPE